MAAEIGAKFRSRAHEAWISDYLHSERVALPLLPRGRVALSAVGTLGGHRLVDTSLVDLLGASGFLVERVGAFPSLQELMDNRSWNAALILSPFKAAATALCTAISPRARQIGTVDTIIRDRDQIFGYNVNSFAIEQALQHLAAPSTPRQALVLGSGAMAACALAGISMVFPSAEIGVLARSSSRAREMIERIGIGCMKNANDVDASLIVHCTTVGEHDDFPCMSLDVEDLFRPGVRLLDVNGRFSSLQRLAIEKGSVVLAGTYLQHISDQLRAALIAG